MESLSYGVKLGNDAAKEFSLGNSKSALDLYKKSIEVLQNSYQTESDERLKLKIYNQIKLYLERAEHIKSILSNPTSPPTRAVPAAIKKEADSPNRMDIKNNVVESAVTWSKVAGLYNVKEIMEEAILIPIKFPQIFTGKIKPWKSILLYGPPGTGKTLIAKACANECKLPLIAISSSDIMSKWQGESEKFIKNFFQNIPDKCIVFFDEVDSMCGERSETDSESSKRVKTELLIQLQDLFESDKQAVIIGATNLPWVLDSAIRRRFEKRVYVPLPDRLTRADILKINLTDILNTLTDSDLDEIAQATKGYNASDLGILVRTSVMRLFKKCKEAQHFKILPNGNYVPCDKEETDIVKMEFDSIPPNKLALPLLDKECILEALSVVSSSVDVKTLEKYDEWTKQYGGG